MHQVQCVYAFCPHAEASKVPRANVRRGSGPARPGGGGGGRLLTAATGMVAAGAR